MSDSRQGNALSDIVLASNIQSVAATYTDPRELAKALDLLAAGSDIDYVGASNIELVDTGYSAGSFEEVEVQNCMFVTVRVRGAQ